MYRFNKILAMSLAFNTGPKEQEIDYLVSWKKLFKQMIFGLQHVDLF